MNNDEAHLSCKTTGYGHPERQLTCHPERQRGISCAALVARATSTFEKITGASVISGERPWGTAILALTKRLS